MKEQRLSTLGSPRGGATLRDPLEQCCGRGDASLGVLLRNWPISGSGRLTIASPLALDISVSLHSCSSHIYKFSLSCLSRVVPLLPFTDRLPGRVCICLIHPLPSMVLTKAIKAETNPLSSLLLWRINAFLKSSALGFCKAILSGSLSPSLISLN